MRSLDDVVFKVGIALLSCWGLVAFSALDEVGREDLQAMTFALGLVISATIVLINAVRDHRRDRCADE